MGVDLTERTFDRFLNRELSWLDFNARVLALADNPAVPILERAKFLSIFSQGLDEFFQVRVAGLKDLVAAGVTTPTPDGRSAAQQLLEIRDVVEDLVGKAERVFLDGLAPALAEVGIVFSSWADLDKDDVKYVDEVFEERIFPVLTPLAVDPGHPFPYISHLSLNLAVVVRDPVIGDRKFARVKVPPLLPRFLVMPDGERFVPLEQVIAFHLDQLFPGMEIEHRVSFRVTRNADLTLDEEGEAEDLLEAVEMELRRRRFRRATRLELDTTAPDEVRELLQRELDVGDDDVYLQAGPLDLGGLWAVHALDRPELKDRSFTPVTPAELVPVTGDRVDMFAVLRDGEMLVHHPYDSFGATVEEFIRQAAADPKVLAMKLTLYRTSDASPIVNSLVRAAERGKQVAVLVEVKARGDEQANIEWARMLEEAGVHVVYGLVGLKTHTKTTLVVRDEPEGMRRYCHIGTGNYNPKTARMYEDLGLLTADPDLGADLTHLFNYLTGYARSVDYHRLLVAPHSLRPSIEELIRAEAALGSEGRIMLKLNSLVDEKMIDILYDASQAGVDIDLVVRGICCLRPGVPGLSDTIRVRSIVGRYLEHSRIYYFEHGGASGEPTFYIGSADLMPRNLDRRVEALVPVTSGPLHERLREILDVNLADTKLAWRLGPDGSWQKVGPASDADTVDAQVRFQELALVRSKPGAERSSKTVGHGRG
ncbi:MAG: polyphosphate kinase 1 [Acidimicrobiales bacterium]